MRQIFQNLKKGEIEIIDTPAPSILPGSVLIKTSLSLISAGTERMLLEFGKATYFNKARQQPEKVKMVMEKISTDGLLPTFEAVTAKLSTPLPLGYCNVGTVVQVSSDIKDLKVGDRVVSNGPHAEVVRVPKNLCARIPDDVDDQSAAFTVVSSIGLQGIRLANPTLGESFAVYGVGLIGLLTVQLLRAHGCRVLAVDLSQERLELAKKFGAEICNPSIGEEPIDASLDFTSGTGLDGVIVTASTSSNKPIKQAAQMCRKRGRIVLVGTTGLDLDRADFYEKELTFQVSCSYGPGRYDVQYEQQGQDYPLPFVRWTEQRNFQAILDMFECNRLQVEDLVTHRFDFLDAKKAYRALLEDKSGLGFILLYDPPEKVDTIRRLTFKKNRKHLQKTPVLGFIGAGNYASRILIPNFKKSDATLHTLVNTGGINNVLLSKNFGFYASSTYVSDVIDNPEINCVVIATRHDSHANLASQALKAGKSVFVEKPLAIDFQGLEEVMSAYQSENKNCAGPQIMIGFNRRFSPHIIKMKGLLSKIKEPKSFIITVNAGSVPAEHWTQKHNIGGGRIIGEACHFIDLMRYLSGGEICSVQACRIGAHPSIDITEDKASITLRFSDGSFGTIFYLANGASGFPKERIEVFVGGKTLQLDNFRSLKAFGWTGFKKFTSWSQEKGQKAAIKAFLEGIEAGYSPIPIDEIFEVTRTSIRVAELLRNQ